MKQTICGAVVLVGLTLALILPVGLAEADRYGQALLTAAGCYLAVHIAAKAGGLYYRTERSEHGRGSYPQKSALSGGNRARRTDKYTTKSITEK